MEAEARTRVIPGAPKPGLSDIREKKVA